MIYNARSKKVRGGNAEFIIGFGSLIALPLVVAVGFAVSTADVPTFVKFAAPIAVVTVFVVSGIVLNLLFQKQYITALSNPNRWDEAGVEEFARRLSAQHGVSGFTAVEAREMLTDYDVSYAEYLIPGGRARYYNPRFVGSKVLEVTNADGKTVEVCLGKDLVSPDTNARAAVRPEHGDWELVFAETGRYTPLPRVDGSLPT